MIFVLRTGGNWLLTNIERRRDDATTTGEGVLNEITLNER